MARQNLSIFNVTQYLDHSYWSRKDKSLVDGLTTKSADLIGDYIIRSIESQGWVVESSYAIIHDKDKREAWNDNLMAMEFQLKDPHIHQAIKLKKGANKGATIDSIAKAIGIEPQYIEKAKAGRYAWDNQLSYLIHAKDVDKYQYKADDVVTLKGDDYIGVYHECKERWERGAIKKTNQKANEDVDWLESQILQGKIYRSQIFLTDEYYRIYSLHSRRLEDAFNAYGQRKMYKALERLQKGEFITTVYYIMGRAGAGKTRFATDFVNHLIEHQEKYYGERWQVCKTASTNPVDDYNGEEVLIMDDVRGSTMRADDWLKLLDPYNSSPSSARYKNKVVTAKVIIITATIPPVKFFYYTKGVGKGTAQDEAIDQFLRRLMGILHVLDYDDIIVNRSIPSDVEGHHVVDKTYFGQDITTKSYYKIDEDKELSNISRDELIEKLTQEVTFNDKVKEYEWEVGLEEHIEKMIEEHLQSLGDCQDEPDRDPS